MSEPKVVHEWSGKTLFMDGTMETTVNGRPFYRDCCADTDVLEEMANLVARLTYVGNRLRQETARVKELEDSLEARRQERDDPKQRVDNCNENAGRKIKRLREALEMIGGLSSYGTLGDLNLYKDKVREYAQAALQGDDR